MEKIVKVEQNTHSKIKIAAAKSGMTMKDFVEYLINKHNEENNNEQRD